MSEITNVESLSSSQLKGIIQKLKNSTDVKEIISTFQLLERFCTTGDLGEDEGEEMSGKQKSSRENGSVNILEDTELPKFLSVTIEKHKSRAVRIHASAFLLTLSFCVGKYKQAFVADTAFSMFINLFQETECPQNLELVEAIQNQLKYSPSRLLDGSVSVVERLTALLRSDNVPDATKGRILEMLSELQDGLLFSPTNDLEAGGKGGGGEEGRGAGGGKGGSSTDDSEVRDCPPSFLHALAGLFAVLSELSAKSRGKLLMNVQGLRMILKERFGEKMEEKKKGVEEKKKKEEKAAEESDIAVEYLNNPSGGYTLGANKLDVTLSSSGWRSLFFNHEITQGIIKSEMQINFNSSTFHYMFGVVTKTALNSLYSTHLGSASSRVVLYMYTAQVYMYGGGSGKSLSGSPPASGVVLGVEVDMSNHTISFFVNGVKLTQPAANGVPSVPLHIGISLYESTTSCKFVSYRRLKTPTPSSVVPTYEQWK